MNYPAWDSGAVRWLQAVRQRPGIGQAPCHRPLPLLRRVHQGPGGLHQRDRPRHGALSLPRAAGPLQRLLPNDRTDHDRRYPPAIRFRAPWLGYGKIETVEQWDRQFPAPATILTRTQNASATCAPAPPPERAPSAKRRIAANSPRTSIRNRPSSGTSVIASTNPLITSRASAASSRASVADSTATRCR